MNQEQVYLTPRENIMASPILFPLLNLETSYRGLPETRTNLKTLNQTDQRKKKQTMGSKPSIVINSFACLCPACASCETE